MAEKEPGFYDPQTGEKIADPPITTPPSPGTYSYVGPDGKEVVIEVEKKTN